MSTPKPSRPVEPLTPRQRDVMFGCVTAIILFIAGLCLCAGLFIGAKLF